MSFAALQAPSQPWAEPSELCGGLRTPWPTSPSRPYHVICMLLTNPAATVSN